MQVYETLKSELIHDPSFEFDDDSRQWVERMIDYTVPGGKMVRGYFVVDSYQLLKGQELTEEEAFPVCALGWCTEWFQAFILAHDDIMDGSHTRRGQPCWFRLPEVGVVAINDGVLLRNHVHRILKKHFQGKAYYVHLVDLFNEIDTGSARQLEQNFKVVYCLVITVKIVQYKGSYYSCYPSDCVCTPYVGEICEDQMLQVKRKKNSL
ncbi:chrysanthemyl diphosphate synthase [Artemisia annua]|uniref:Chrysanthemyl diphosphate synthase n=1 Tax=Artemisia annua TaxID=35608 RepID=A0A2U1ND88_ARTAN|nr:chrysanthemyl diphosphate synthase [Artemisia annua]